MTNTAKLAEANPKHAFLLRGRNGEPVQLSGARIRELVSPLPVQGDPTDPEGLRITAHDIVATVRQIKHGLVVTLSPELEWEEFSQLVDAYLVELGEAVGQSLEIVEL